MDHMYCDCSTLTHRRGCQHEEMWGREPTTQKEIRTRSEARAKAKVEREQAELRADDKVVAEHLDSLGEIFDGAKSIEECVIRLRDCLKFYEDLAAQGAQLIEEPQDDGLVWYTIPGHTAPQEYDVEGEPLDARWSNCEICPK